MSAKAPWLNRRTPNETRAFYAGFRQAIEMARGYGPRMSLADAIAQLELAVSVSVETAEALLAAEQREAQER